MVYGPEFKVDAQFKNVHNLDGELRSRICNLSIMQLRPRTHQIYFETEVTLRNKEEAEALRDYLDKVIEVFDRIEGSDGDI